MSWNDFAFFPPTAFDLSGAGGGGFIADDLINTPNIDVLDPDADFRLGAITGDGPLYGFTQSSIKQLIVHPWQEGIGQGFGVVRYLSPRNAVDFAANKFFDSPDDLIPIKTGNVDVLGLLVTGTGYANFNANLNNLLRVFSDSTLYMCARRSSQIAALESNKVVLPDAAKNCRWDHVTESHHSTWADYSAAVGHVNALSYANEIGNASLEEAVMVLANKKTFSASKATTEAELIIGRINGSADGVKCFFINNKTTSIVKKILLASDTGLEYPLCACVIYCGAVGSLDHLKEIFSL